MSEQERMRGFSQPRHRDVSTARSPLVRVLKIALPLTVVALALALLLWPTIQNQMIADLSEPIKISEPERIRAQTQNRLLGAKFSSVTESGLPFNIESQEATQSLSNPDQIEMTKPVATLTLDDGGALTLSSQKGRVNQESGDLVLTGEVILTRDDGTTLKTEAISANMKQGTADGNDTVVVTGPDGRIDATGLSLRDQGNVLIFKGPARLEMNQDATMNLSSHGGV